MSAATDAVASAILSAAAPVDALLPDVAVVKSMVVVRNDVGAVIDMNLAVVLNGVVYQDCAWSGAFALQVGSSSGSALVGKSVRVELVGGLFLVSDTVNWSAT